MGEYTTNNFFYKPHLGARGEDEKNKFDAALDYTDTELADLRNKKHDRVHAINSPGDHTSAITPGSLIKADSNGLPAEASAADVADVLSNTVIKVKQANYIELGSDITDKASSAGTIDVNRWTPNTLEIVGMGTTTDSRQIKLWAEGGCYLKGCLYVDTEGLSVPGGILLDERPSGFCSRVAFLNSSGDVEASITKDNLNRFCIYTGGQTSSGQEKFLIDSAGKVTITNALDLANWAVQNFSASGYVKIGSVIVQWGTTVSFYDAGPCNKVYTIVFPMAFPNAILGISATAYCDDLPSHVYKGYAFIGAVSTTQFTGVVHKVDTSGTFRLKWIAIGY